MEATEITGTSEAKNRDLLDEARGCAEKVLRDGSRPQEPLRIEVRQQRAQGKAESKRLDGQFICRFEHTDAPYGGAILGRAGRLKDPLG